MNATENSIPQTEEPAPYLARYGLTAAPFSSGTGGAGYFEDAETVHRLNLLQHLSQSSNLLLIVVGAAGAGKTALLRRFVEGLDQRWSVCRVQAAEAMTGLQALRQIAQCCELPTDCGQPAMQHLLGEHSAKLGHDGQVPLVVVDDADLLSSDALGLLAQLSQMTGDDVAPWHVLLFAAPTIVAALNGDSSQWLAEGKYHVVKLPPYAERQTASYLRHRLVAAGFHGEFPFTDDQITRIHRESGGLPGRINELAHQTLLELPTQRSVEPVSLPASSSKQRPLTRLGVVATVALATAIVIVLIFQDRINALFQPTPDVHPVSRSVPAEPGAGTVLPLPAPASGTAQLKPRADEHLPPSYSPGTREPVQKEPARLAEDIAASTPPAQHAPPMPLQTQPSAGLPPAPKPEPGNDGAAPAANVAPPTPKPAPATAEQASGAKKATPAPAVPQPSTESPRTPAPQLERPAESAHPGKEWILAQNPRAYTLQLLGSIDEQQILKVIHEYGLQKSAAYYHILYKGKDWYVLVYGVFPDFDSAKNGIQDLPAPLRVAQPWVRRIQSVQNEVHAGKK